MVPTGTGPPKLDGQIKKLTITTGIVHKTGSLSLAGFDVSILEHVSEADPPKPCKRPAVARDWPGVGSLPTLC